MSSTADPVVSGAAPGWFGKLPGMSDTAHRRLAEAACEVWDRWLRGELARMDVHHRDWAGHSLEAPLWCFVLGNDVIDGQRWIGVLAPSVDRLGQHFPFALMSELVSPESDLRAEALSHVRQWWRLASRVVRDGIQGELDAVGFEVLLHRRFAGGIVPDAGDDEAALALPDVGQSLWFTDPTAEGGLGIASRGLPQDEQFDALFGCVPGGTSRDAGDA